MKINLFQVLITFLIVTGLMGCTMATPVVTSGSYEGLANTDPSKGTIFVYRGKAFAGAANQYDVMLNEVLVGSLPNGSFFTVEAEPGENKIEPRTLTSFDFGKGSAVSVEPGGSYCLKLTLNFCMQCKSADINVVDDQQCESEISSLKKVQLK